MPHETPAAAPPLDRLQRWMQAVIVHPGTIGEALVAAEAANDVAPERLEEVVRPSWSLTAAERVDVYHGMYLLRMTEALESDYPALRHFLGAEAFEDLVREYVQAYPSRSYTLNRLGDHLPRFLAEGPARPNGEFLHDLAQAELAITQVFDEEESPPVDGESLRAVPPEGWGTVSLRPTRALRLLNLRYGVFGHLDAAKHDRPAPRPRRRATFLAFYRRAYSVMRLELGRQEHALLSALTSGVPLGEALARSAREMKESKREQAVFRCFRTWLAEGLFSAIEVGESSSAGGGQVDH